MTVKSEFLKTPIEHVDITRDSVVPIVEAMGQMAYSARDLHRAATIYDRMLRDRDCGVILCLAGSLISAGLKRVFADMIRNHMVDAIVSTGANIVDQDFFEALGFKHWMAEDRFKYGLDDDKLREMHIDRIYDTLIDEDELRICDETIHKITDSLDPRPYSSREFVGEMGKYLAETGAKTDASIVLEAFREEVPIFCPAFSDCSAGFGLVAHQAARHGKPKVSLDSAKDFYELTRLKVKNESTGLVHDRRRRAEKLRAGYRRRRRSPGTRRPDAQIRNPDHGRRRARRRTLRQHAQRSQQLGQSRYDVRADGVLRSDNRSPADRRLRVSQARLGRPHLAQVELGAG